MFERQLTARQRERLKKTIARGKQSYLWKRGVLTYGLITFAVSSAWQYFYFRTLAHRPVEVQVLDLLVLLPVFLVAGYVWGLCMWGYYKSLLEER